MKMETPYMYQLEDEEYPMAIVFDYCLQGKCKIEEFHPLSWEIIAMISEDIGEVSLAKQIKRKYCQTELIESAGSSIECKG